MDTPGAAFNRAMNRRWQDCYVMIKRLFSVLLLMGMLSATLVLSANAQEQAVIHVALSPFEGQANVYYAQDLGLLKQAGLNVEIQQAQGSAATVAGIIGGSLQIGAGSPIPLVTARERGFDLMLIAPGTIADSATQTGLTSVATSALRSGKDLAGKAVGVNTLGSVDQIAVQSWVDRTGGDSKSVKFLEVPGTLMLDAITTGRIDAALMADPNYSIAIASGRTRVLALVNDAIAKRFMITA